MVGWAPRNPIPGSISNARGRAGYHRPRRWIVDFAVPLLSLQFAGCVYETGQEFENYFRRGQLGESERCRESGSVFGDDVSRARTASTGSKQETLSERVAAAAEELARRLGRSGRGGAGARRVHGADRERRGAGGGRLSAAARGDQAGFGDPVGRPPRGGGATSPYRNRPDGAGGNRGSNRRFGRRDRTQRGTSDKVDRHHLRTRTPGERHW